MGWELIAKDNRKENWTRIYKNKEWILAAIQMNAFKYEVGLWKKDKLIHLKQLIDKSSAKESVKLLKNWSAN